MRVAGYLKTSLIEWPGKISSVIFVPGCNFRCPFCHNADLVGNHGLPQIDEKQIFADLVNRRKWVEAVVVTGGEPTLQRDLPKFFKLLKSLKLLTMVHTNGTRPKVISKLVINKLVDYVCIDLKGDFENYGRYVGMQKSKVKSQKLNLKVKKTMGFIVESGVEYEFRTTVVPGLHNLENLTELAKEIWTTVYSLRSTVDSSLKAVDGSKWYLQQFRPVNTLNEKYLKIKPYSKEKMERFCRELRKIIPQTSLRGV